MSLTPEQHRLRDGKVTASFVPYLMAGDTDKILSEWRRLVGDPAWEADDLSDNWPVQFGSYIETFALDWHEQKTGQPLTRRGEVVTHPELPHVCATLDAFREADGCALDCKALGAWRKIDERSQFYTPQLIVQSGCTTAKRAALLIIHGGAEPQEYPVEWTAEYADQVWRRIDQFWRCVLDLVPPVDVAPTLAPVPAIKEYDMAASNAWADRAAAWLASRAAAKEFDGAVKELKTLVPADAARCFGHGIRIDRAKNGNLSIKEHAA